MGGADDASYVASGEDCDSDSSDSSFDEALKAVHGSDQLPTSVLVSPNLSFASGRQPSSSNVCGNGKAPSTSARARLAASRYTYWSREKWWRSQFDDDNTSSRLHRGLSARASR